MGLQTRIRRELKFLSGLMRTLWRVRSIAPDSTHLICDDIQAAVDDWRDRRAMTFEGAHPHLWRARRHGQPLRPLGQGA